MIPMDDSGSTSDACSVSNNLHHDEVTTSYFSREEIEKNSPSRRDGIDLKIETFQRKSYCTFLKELGDRLKLGERTTRLVLLPLPVTFTLQTIATVCMLLAGKVEETPLDLKEIIILSYEIIKKEDLDDDQRKEVYEKQEELVLSGEELVRSKVNIDRNVYHPYEPLEDAIEKYIDEPVKAQLCKVAESYVYSCLCTSLCLQYEPHHIAGYAFCRAAKHFAVKLQAHREVLHKEFNITRSQLEDINDQMLERDAWYFSREEIEKISLSKLDGIDLKNEAHLRKSYCTFLNDLGVRLNVGEITARLVFMPLPVTFTLQTIATACMLLAGKVEEDPKDLKDIIVSSYEIIHKTKLDADRREKVYEEQEELVLSGEELVLSTLNFDLTVRHPYQPLESAIGKYKGIVANARFPEVAVGIVNKCLQTTLSLQYKPYHIAGYGFFRAAAYLKMNPQLQEYAKVLYQEFDVTRSQLEDMNGQMVVQRKNDSNESGTQNPDDNPVQDRSMPEGTGKASESEA